MAEMKFLDRDIGLILASLPKGIPRRKTEWLGKILQEWARVDLPEHLEVEPASKIKRRADNLRDIGRLASDLNRALQSIKADDNEFWIIRELLAANGIVFSLDGEKRLARRLAKERSFLTELTSASKFASAKSKNKKGRPTNFSASLIIRDLAAIFEWVTGERASRRVDRIDAKPEGPFWDFAAAIWPVIFGADLHGLEAAIKKLMAARHKKLTGTRSPVLDNMELNHPSWRIFDR